jgi:gas vesicle protein
LAKKIAEKIPTWISRILLPEIRNIVKEEISNQLKPIETKISALDEKIEERTKALEKEIISLRNEMNARFDSIEKRLPLIERLALLEARMEKIEKHIGIH